jgi:hypothetical protein
VTPLLGIGNIFWILKITVLGFCLGQSLDGIEVYGMVTNLYILLVKLMYPFFNRFFFTVVANLEVSVKAITAPFFKQAFLLTRCRTLLKGL